jgi:hypothetical protein
MITSLTAIHHVARMRLETRAGGECKQAAAESGTAPGHYRFSIICGTANIYITTQCLVVHASSLGSMLTRVDVAPCCMTRKPFTDAAMQLMLHASVPKTHGAFIVRSLACNLQPATDSKEGSMITLLAAALACAPPHSRKLNAPILQARMATRMHSHWLRCFSNQAKHAFKLLP